MFKALFGRVDEKAFDRDCVVAGVNFPGHDIFKGSEAAVMLGDLTVKSSIDIAKVLSGVTLRLKRDDKGKEKKDGSFAEAYKYFISIAGGSTEYLPSNYEFFGHDEPVRILQEFLKSNPFFACALTHVVEDGKTFFEVNMVDTVRNTWFSRIMAIYDASFPRINVRFDANMNLVSHTVTNATGGAYSKELSLEEAMSYLLFLLTYYFECVHALIHIFHVLLVSGLVDSTRHSKFLSAFAGQYSPNIILKFVEVKKLLLAEHAGLTGKGYNGDRAQRLVILGDIMKVWGGCKTAKEMLDNFYFHSAGGIETLRSHGILTEFFKHVDLLSGFASELNAAFCACDQHHRDVITANVQLSAFMRATGPNGPRVTSIQQWIELMALTGILHGATISATRLCASFPVAKLFYSGNKWTNEDVSNIATVLNTITGVMDEHSVFTNLMQKEVKNPLIRAVELKYGGRSASLKLDYFLQIEKLPDFHRYGWIWTDYAPDLIDGKQFTIDTYI